MVKERFQRGTEMVTHTHEAMNVPNEVLWASDLAREKLGMHAMTEYSGPLFLWTPGNEIKGHFGARKFHHRSFNIDVPRAEGEEGVQVSIKGAGFFNGNGVEEWIEKGDTKFGLMSIEGCVADKKNSLRLKALGIPTAEPIAIIRLKALPVRTYGGHTNMVPVPVLKETGKLEADFDPGVLVRVCISDTRIEDIIEESRGSNRKPHEHLKRELPHILQSLEAKLGTQFTPQKYLEWIADRYGRSLGKMHAAGISHRYLHEGNLTLAGEMIDNADCEDFLLPDMAKTVTFDDMHEALNTAQRIEETLKLVKEDIGREENENNLGIWPIIFSYAYCMVHTFPESFKHEIEEWGNDEMNYYFEQLCPELDDMFWRAYLEEAPHLAFLHDGFRFPRQGEKGRKG